MAEGAALLKLDLSLELHILSQYFFLRKSTKNNLMVGGTLAFHHSLHGEESFSEVRKIFMFIASCRSTVKGAGSKEGILVEASLSDICLWKGSIGKKASLNWAQRTKITVDAAKGAVKLLLLTLRSYATQQLTEKSDVYSFGVVLLKLFFGCQCLAILVLQIASTWSYGDNKHRC